MAFTLSSPCPNVKCSEDSATRPRVNPPRRLVSAQSKLLKGFDAQRLTASSGDLICSRRQLQPVPRHCLLADKFNRPLKQRYSEKTEIPKTISRHLKGPRHDVENTLSYDLLKGILSNGIMLVGRFSCLRSETCTNLGLGKLIFRNRKTSCAQLDNTDQTTSADSFRLLDPSNRAAFNVNEIGKPAHVSSIFSKLLRESVAFFLILSVALAQPALPSLALDEGSDASPAYERPAVRPDVPMTYDTSPEGLRTPQQVHVTLAGPQRMTVSWITQDAASPSFVEYGTAPGIYTRKAEGKSLSYTYLQYKSGLIHSAVLGSDSEPLKDGAEYFYRCGGEGREFSFKTPPAEGPDTPMLLNVVGDLGQTGWSVSTLAHMAKASYDLTLYAGDLSYADRYQPRWDSWGRLMEPLTSARPWMMVEGNHEIENVFGLEPAFKAYNARWPMPAAVSGSPSNMYYSFETGGAHFLMLGSYADYSPGSEQYEWLKKDLAKVDRSKTPWLIAVLHAPWYNSNTAHQGEADEMMAAMEPMLHEAQVDFLFSGHVHAYERSTRVFNGRPDACGTIHITIGDGGNREGLASEYLNPQPEWSLRREASFGHGELELLNSSTARWTWHRNDDDEAVVADDVWVQSLHSSRNVCTPTTALLPQ
eukprot:TRINITY_DN38638_c0_g1_i1.p1 TRINITY_DN38638_c0_g1~~TRINITY_DN38638_c0_g1_i1.p1  ORF type:complete len:661 (-),score=50.59 TRINITY_DN38638_c0_g1_i1:630-2567(-)